MTPQHPTPKDRRSGFALLITVVLLAFLVLLMVSLATLTRVETQVAANTHQYAQARQNALMALNIALGQLQLTLGPDRRISATASQKGDGVPNYGNQDVDNNANWVGVYRQNPTTTTRDPQLLTWLVSGNQNISVPANTANTPGIVPNASVAGLSSGMNASTPVSVGGREAILLVGPGSAMAETPTSAPPSVVDRFVVAPLENIQVPTGNIPGMDATSTLPTTIGRFAYWVGDEGVKAKVSLTDPWKNATATDEKAYRLRVAQRAGIEQVDSSTGTALGLNYAVNDAGLAKVLSLEQLPLSNASGQTALGTAVKNRFHDLTGSSYSVLADVAQGGLKKDLTAWLAHSEALRATGAPADNDFMAPLASGDISGFTMPRWGLLRSYDQLNRTQPVPANTSEQTDKLHGFHPVITYFRAAFGASCSGDNQPLAAHMFPVLKLWNPYSIQIPGGSYEFVFGTRYNSNNVTFRTSVGVKGMLLLAVTPTLSTSNSSSTGTQATRQYTRFRVSSPPIEPGECLVFTLASTGPYKDTTDPTAIQLVSTPGVFPAVDNSVYWENPAITLTPAERAGTIRVDVPGGECELALYPVPLTNVANPTVDQWRQIAPYHLLQHFGVTARTFNGMAIGQVYDDAIPGPHFWFALPGVRDHATQFFRNPRLLANFNPRAPLHLMVPNPSAIVGQAFFGDTAAASPNMDVFDTNKASAGYSARNDSATNSPAVPLVITELPPTTTSPEARFVSLAQLQHVNFSKITQSPTYAAGNSEVNYLVGLTSTDLALVPNTTNIPATQITRVYDVSYLLNQTIWDRYFFSTIPQSLTDGQINDPGFLLPNGRHRFHRKDGSALTATSATQSEAFNHAASLLLLNGGFNVNSASVQAWRALLACHNSLGAATGSGFSRFSNTGANDSSNAPRTSGYRILSQAQINRLADAIVAEVKLRGPFLSLSAFVNRTLAADATGYKGPLQAAIDATDLSTTAAERINALPEFTDPLHQAGVQSYLPNSVASLAQQKLHLASIDDPNSVRTRPSGSRAAFLPGFLSQADLLNSLGPVLTARSDTFVVRAYGDVLNTLTGTTTPEARAWCEAVVQRLPQYVADGVSPSATPPPGSESDTFGRRFKIVSFRWLTASDI